MLKNKHGIQVKGLVTVKQGERVIARDIPNHFVNSGLKGLLSQIINAGHDSGGSHTYHYLWAYTWHIYLGSDTTTPTTTTMTVLASPIGTAPGTPASSQGISTKDGSSDGIWSATFVATWNVGTVSGTLGELALYMKARDQTGFKWKPTTTYNPAEVMISRLSSADVDFSSFIINNTLPLTVEWTVQFSFV